MRIISMLMFVTFFSSACTVSHQGHANTATLTLTDAGQSSGYYKFDDEKYLRSMSNAR